MMESKGINSSSQLLKLQGQATTGGGLTGEANRPLARLHTMKQKPSNEFEGLKQQVQFGNRRLNIDEKMSDTQNSMLFIDGPKQGYNPKERSKFLNYSNVKLREESMLMNSEEDLTFTVQSRTNMS